MAFGCRVRIPPAPGSTRCDDAFGESILGKMKGPVMDPVRLGDGDDLGPVLDMLHSAFAYMEGRIDPPSSLARMTVESLARDAAEHELWVIPGPLACVILTPEPDYLYVGKLAVADAARGQGLAWQLMQLAMVRAKVLGLPKLQLQTRIELVENQRLFTRMGFAEVARTAHAGYDRPTSITYELPV